MPAFRVVAIFFAILFVSCLVGQQPMAELPKAPDSIEMVAVRVFDGMARAGIVHSPDGKTFMTSGDGTLRKWDFESGEELSRVEHPLYKNLIVDLPGRGLSVLEETYIVDGKYRERRLFDALTRKEILAFDNVHATAATQFTPGGNYLFGWQNNGGACLWDATNGKLIAPNPLDMIDKPLEVCIWSPDGRYFIYGNERTPMTLLEARTGKAIWKVGPDDSGSRTNAFSPDGLYLAGGQATSDDELRLRVASTGKTLAVLKWQPDGVFNRVLERMMPKEGRDEGVRCVAFSPDGKTLVVACRDQRVAVIEVATWQMRYRVEESAERIVFFPGGFLIATSDFGHGKPLRVWDRMNPSVVKVDANEEQIVGALPHLDSGDAAVAWKAMLQMTGNPNATVRVFQRVHSAIPTIEEGEVRKILRSLDDDEFEVRELAFKRLYDCGSAVDSVLRVAAKEKRSAEAGKRLLELVGHLDDRLNVERLRAVRMTEVLEYLNSPSSTALLEIWARGARGAFLTEEARLSLLRLKR